MKETKYHRVTVTMKTGFVYSFACIGRFLEGMKKSSDGYWTKKIVVEDITKEQYEEMNTVIFKENRKEEKVVPKTLNPQFSSLENFFESTKPAPKNKKPKKRV